MFKTNPLRFGSPLVTDMGLQSVFGNWTTPLFEGRVNTEPTANITGVFVSIDPSFHAKPPNIGRVVVDSPGAWATGTLTIDTTKLSKGMHKLFIRMDSFVPPGVIHNPSPNNKFSTPDNPFVGGTVSGGLL